jgi:hypothetical protein
MIFRDSVIRFFASGFFLKSSSPQKFRILSFGLVSPEKQALACFYPGKLELPNVCPNHRKHTLFPHIACYHALPGTNSPYSIQKESKAHFFTANNTMHPGRLPIGALTIGNAAVFITEISALYGLEL